jgi:hypothetical protein
MAHQTAVAILAACLVAQAMAQTVAPKTSTAAPVCVLQATIDSKQSNVQISGDVSTRCHPCAGPACLRGACLPVPARPRANITLHL